MAAEEFEDGHDASRFDGREISAIRDIVKRDTRYYLSGRCDNFFCELIRRFAMWRGFVAAALAFGLTGCAGLNYALENYTGVDVMPVDYGGHTWRVFDKPAENRLMITPSIGRSMGVGAASGVTFGADSGIPKPEFQGAVEAWFMKTGRTCQITDGYIVANPQWEFRYTCN